MKSATVFTEAGTTYGYGHLTRCIAIAQALYTKKIKTHFIIRGDISQFSLLAGCTFEITEWNCFRSIEKIPVSFLSIIDSYYADEDLCRYIQEKSHVSVFIDDYNRIIYPGGYVLNSGINAEHIRYPVCNNVEYLLGARFQPLRMEFWDTPQYQVNEGIENILMIFGGSDASNKTLQYYRLMRSFFPDKQFHVITGMSQQSRDSILAENDRKTTLYRSLSTEDVMRVMVNADLAVSAAGQTIFELARIGVPTVGVVVAKNQEYNYNNWVKTGFLFHENEISRCFSYEQRRNASDIGRSIVDGKGVFRIIEKLL